MNDQPAFTAASAWAVLRGACATAGLDDRAAELLRLGENALYRLPASQVVVRIARSTDYRADAAKEVEVGRWLAAQDFPAAETHDIPQPIEVDGHPVTFWRFISGRPGDRRDVATLGQLLRRLHALPVPSTFTLPAQNPTGRIARRITTAAVPTQDKRFLLDLLAEVEAALPDLHYPLPPSPVHGDAHVKNLMIRDGRPVLLDFERFSYGHPEWDLAMTATEHRTAQWWSDEEYATFAEAYGYDVTTWSGFEILRTATALGMSTWLMQNIATSPEIAAEYQTRIGRLRGETGLTWQPF